MMPTIDTAWRTGRNNFNLLRLFAAWLVIYSHSRPITGTAGADLVGRLILTKSGGMLAVDIFFLISGFLVAASFQRNPLRAFVLARALRIYPALIVCVALSVCVLGPLLSTAPDYWRHVDTWRYFWANASLWRAEFWLPGVFDTLPHTAVNGSLWTMPIEGRLYVALMLAGLVGMLAPRRYLAAWALAMAGAGAFAYLRAPLPQHLEHLTWVTAFYITGTLLWTWRARIRLGWWPLLPLLFASVAVRGSPWFVPLYFATVTYGTFCIAFLPQWPTLGRTDFSYGLYLYGWPMQQLALMAGASTVLSNTLAATVLALACAAGSWFLVERPALQLKQRFAPAAQA